MYFLDDIYFSWVPSTPIQPPATPVIASNSAPEASYEPFNREILPEPIHPMDGVDSI